MYGSFLSNTPYPTYFQSVVVFFFPHSAAVPLNVLSVPFVLDEASKVGVCGDWFRADDGGECNE